MFFLFCSYIHAEPKQHKAKNKESLPPTNIFKFKLLKSIEVNNEGGKNTRTIKAGTEFTLLDHESFHCEFWETLIEVDGERLCAPYSILATAVNLRNTRTKDLVIHSGLSAEAVKVEGDEEPQTLRLTNTSTNLPPGAVIRMVVLPSSQSPCPERSVLIEHIYREIGDPSSNLEEEEDRHPLYCVSYKWLMKSIYGGDSSTVPPSTLAARDKAMHVLQTPSNQRESNSKPATSPKETPTPEEPPFKKETRVLKKNAKLKLINGKSIDLIAGMRLELLPPSSNIKCQTGYIAVLIVKLNKKGCIANNDFYPKHSNETAPETKKTPKPPQAEETPLNPGTTKLQKLHVRPDGHLSSRGHSEPQFFMSEQAKGQRIRAYYSEDERDPYRLLTEYNKNKSSTTTIPKLKVSATSPNREISQSFATALDKYFESCVKTAAGVSSITGQIDISHIGIKKDARHSSRSLHAIGRAMDMTGIYFTADGKEKRYVLAYGNLARMKAPENRNALEKEQYSFWTKFSACMKSNGFSTRTFDKTHPKHVHVGWPSQSLQDKYGIWTK